MHYFYVPTRLVISIPLRFYWDQHKRTDHHNSYIHFNSSKVLLRPWSQISRLFVPANFNSSKVLLRLRRQIARPVAWYDFNSSKVLLRPRMTAQKMLNYFISIPLRFYWDWPRRRLASAPNRDFNSSKVLLRLNPNGRPKKLPEHFNSSKVLLRPADYYPGMLAFWEFQFL